MKYAVIQLGGKQLRVSEGDTFEIERQPKLNIDVLMYSNDGETLIGAPSLENVKIKATITQEKMGDKVVVARYKSKSRYRKVKGHRQPLSVVKIEEINYGVKRASAEKATKVAEEPKAKKTIVAEEKKKVETKAKKATTKEKPVTKVKKVTKKKE